ncbi:MAG TPA: hypothetical protein VM390_00900 [Acidimicrobiales bacterium]|nr:hypothetical protein [Acidimicrobiales bacterium]
MRGRRARGLAVATALVAAQLSAAVTWPPPASAATISIAYDPTLPGAVDPCAATTYTGTDGTTVTGPLRACQGGHDRTGELQSIMEAAAAWYGSILRDDHHVAIRWAWLGPFEKDPDALVLARQAGSERPVESRIRIPAHTPYVYDPTPHDDDGFQMRPRLYRTLHPAEQAAAFDGAPPEVLEVAYVGRTQAVPDLLTHVLHEMGHALGLSGGPEVGPGPACHGSDDPAYRPAADLVGGSPIGIKALPNATPAQQCVHLELGGIQECKTDPDHKVGDHPDEAATLAGFTLWECASHQSLYWSSDFPLARMRPSVVDLLALSLAGGWQELHLPRKYTAGPGDWASGGTWIGGRPPSVSDDVYVVNTVAGAKVWETPAGGASVANLYVSEQNTVRTAGGALHVGGELRVAGPNSPLGPLRLAPASGGGDDDELAGGALTRLQVGTAAMAGEVRAMTGDVEFGGALQLQHPAAKARIGALRNAGVIVGHGEVRTSQLVNFARIRPVGGTLVIGTPPSDPGGDLVVEPALLDLDGPFDIATEILAVDGDLVFDGIIADPVSSTVRVGPERSIRFTSGWHQASNGVLVMDGTAWPAWVFGSTTLDGTLEIDGVGRFEDDLTLGPTSVVAISIAGTGMVSEHDFLSVHGPVSFGGTLALELAGGYQPAPLDTFVIASYGSRTGEFDQITGAEIGGGLVLVPQYRHQELVLVASFAGASPGEANCTGKAVAEQVAVHGSVKAAADFHGLSVQQLQSAVSAYCSP